MDFYTVGKAILIVKNVTREGPGIIEDILKEHGIEYNIVDLSQEQHYISLENYGAVIVLGGPDSANDRSQKIETELALITEVLEAKIPYLGICLGLQTGVKAAGGNVVSSQTKEVGFRDPDGSYFNIELTEDGKKDLLFKDLDNSFNVFHLHGETVILTERMKVLAVGKFCRNQVVKIGPSSYGIQCHFEITPEMLEIWIKEDPDLQKLDRDQLRSDFKALKDTYSHVGNQLFRNFLKIAGYL
jgi:GMP synthase (glutamine-hydrolysing)